MLKKHYYLMLIILIVEIKENNEISEIQSPLYACYTLLCIFWDYILLYIFSNL